MDTCWNLAQAFEDSGDLKAARVYYGRYFDLAVSDADRLDALARLDALKTR